MEPLDPTAGLIAVDDLLDLTFCDEENTKLSSSSLESLNPDIIGLDDQSRSFSQETGEEELEWISNKDAFPSVETYLDFLPLNLCHVSIRNQKSPDSVLEIRNITSNAITSCCGSFQVPARTRSKQKRKQNATQWGNQVNVKIPKEEPVALPPQRTSGTRRCQHCLAEKTPQWRAGPMGPKTLCNACGVRYKSGRLVPEYRPASSPTFSSELHSNSHRKIMEMRRQNQASDGYRKVA